MNCDHYYWQHSPQQWLVSLHLTHVKHEALSLTSSQLHKVEGQMNRAAMTGEGECSGGKVEVEVEVDGVVGRLEPELEISEPEEVQLPEVAAGSGMQCEPRQHSPTGPWMRTTPDLVREIALEQIAQSSILEYQHSSAQLTQPRHQLLP